MIISGLSCCLSEKGVQKVEGLIKDFMGIDVNDGNDVRSWIVGAQETGNKDSEEALVKTRNIYQLSYERAGDKAFQEGRQDEAIKNYEQAVKYTVESPLVEAAQGALKWVGIKPAVSDPDPEKRNSYLYFKLGGAYNKMGRSMEHSQDTTPREYRKVYSTAASNYIKAAESTSDNIWKASCYADAAFSMRNSGDSKEALRLIDKAIQLNPGEYLKNIKIKLMGTAK